MKDRGANFGLAGLWERWKPGDDAGPVETFNHHHDGRPTPVCAAGLRTPWADPLRPGSEAPVAVLPRRSLSRPTRLSRAVGNVKNDGPEAGRGAARVASAASGDREGPPYWRARPILCLACQAGEDPAGQIAATASPIDPIRQRKRDRGRGLDVGHRLFPRLQRALRKCPSAASWNASRFPAWLGRRRPSRTRSAHRTWSRPMTSS